MTRKHYVAIARILSARLEAAQSSSSTRAAAVSIELIALDMADYFASENPQFDRERFLHACGVGAGKEITQ